MKRLLIVKTSSMGDVIHTLPALTDALSYVPDLHCDWVVEESFQEIPRLHPGVNEVIPVALRRWRREVVHSFRKGEYGHFLKKLRSQSYDFVIDAQGLIKSALLTRVAKATQRWGYHWGSAREPLASLMYSHQVKAPLDSHAIDKIRQLFAQALGYPLPQTPVNYGLKPQESSLPIPLTKPYIVLCHGTSRAKKYWPLAHWQQLASLLNQKKLTLVLPWGNGEEQARAHEIANKGTDAVVLPRCSLKDMASILSKAAGAVSVDTGLGHMAAALNVPNLSLYGPTKVAQVGTIGQHQGHLSLDSSPSQVMDALCQLMH